MMTLKFLAGAAALAVTAVIVLSSSAPASAQRGSPPAAKGYPYQGWDYGPFAHEPGYGYYDYLVPRGYRYRRVPYFRR